MTEDTEITPSPDALTADEQAAFEAMQREEEPAPPEPEKTVEPEKPDDPPAEPEKPEQEPEVQKLVPHGAFEEERRRRKEWQARTRDLELQLAKLQGQQEALKPTDQQQPVEIDPEKNPIEAIKSLKAEIQARKDAEAQQTAIQQIISTGQTYCRTFAEKEPQFFGVLGQDGKQQEGAYQFLRRAVAERLADQGIPTQEIEARVNLEEITLINDSLARGLDPARAMWHWAQVAGFKPQSAQPQEQPRNGSGQFAPKAPSEAERLSNLAKAEAASKSLGSAPGGAAPETGLEALANMSEEEFADATKGGKWEKLWR